MLLNCIKTVTNVWYCKFIKSHQLIAPEVVKKC
jgi:hypothetical protein